ncbi:MAG: NADP-dependent oxidoreductase (plasmid) [Leptolyngbya sp. BL-A-14]
MVPKPASIGFAVAAGIPSIALTAWQALFDLADLQPEQTILIHGASGGVGCFAVQYAKRKGAIAIGTASTANVEPIKQLGVDQAIDYKRERFEEKVANVDFVLDTIGGEARQRSWQTLKPGGLLISTEGAAEPVVSPLPELRGVPIFVEPSGSNQLRQIGRLIDSGYLKPPTVEVFPLREAAKVHDAIQNEHRRGKFVLQIA